MGKLIISGNGKENEVIRKIWIMSAVTGVLGVVFVMLVAHQIGDTLTSNIQNFLIGVAWLGAVAAIVEAMFKKRRVESTYIDVYENGIHGRGVATNFPWAMNSYAAMSGFNYKFEQITSVEVQSDNAIIIHATSAIEEVEVSHKCYAMNANEVREMILKGMEDGALLVVVEE